jgi:hypothetical protein
VPVQADEARAALAEREAEVARLREEAGRAAEEAAEQAGAWQAQVSTMAEEAAAAERGRAHYGRECGRGNGRAAERGRAQADDALQAAGEGGAWGRAGGDLVAEERRGREDVGLPSPAPSRGQKWLK